MEAEVLSVEEKIADIAQKSERVAVEEWREDDAKITHLKRERSQIDLDQVTDRENLEAERKKANRSVMKRLFSGSEALKPLQAKVDALVSRREEIEEELHSLEEDRTRKKSEVKKFDSDLSELRATLEGLKADLGEVQAEKQEVTQITEKRAAIAKSMAEMISSLHFSDPPRNEPKEIQ